MTMCLLVVVVLGLDVLDLRNGGTHREVPGPERHAGDHSHE